MTKKNYKVGPKKSCVSAAKSSSDYENDFYQWTQKQAEFLRNEDFSKLDYQNLMEEIESLGKSDKRALESQLIRLLAHKLKLMHQPERKFDHKHWNQSINGSSIEISLILRDSPSLESSLDQIFQDAYSTARHWAAKETKLKLSEFSKKCPWKLEEIRKELDF